MRFRRRRLEAADQAEAGGPRDGPGRTGRGADGDDAETTGPAAGPRARGPWDVSEVEPPDEEARNRLDLGGLMLSGRDGVEVRLQVDEGSGEVAAVLLVAEDGAVELRPFAVPRHEDLWDDVLRQIAAETARRGGTATEVEGPYGAALQVHMTGRTPEGQTVTQASLVLGISGPRWLLRATLLGRPAVAYRDDGLVESALRDVVVVRGGTPMPPGEPLPLTMPPGVRGPAAGPAG